MDFFCKILLIYCYICKWFFLKCASISWVLAFFFVISPPYFIIYTNLKAVSATTPSIQVYIKKSFKLMISEYSILSKLLLLTLKKVVN
jgi:hypothetical protein